ncbi:sugar phosphate isomerase/epimerase family protein [Methanocaldococcus indicus]|uniref:sugar phosphate isomerase/epimerase family protein n=1 Tax=Methanocaldococcus indicus TaxID=213231 RepID=UPI003C6D36CF
MEFAISSLVFLPERLESSIEKIVENNFKYWEVVCEGHHYLTPKNIKTLLRFRDEYNISYTVHAPFSDLNPASMNEKVRKLVIECISDAIEGAYELDANIVVIHPGYIPELWKDFKDDILDNNFTTILKIVEIAEDYDIILGLENMPNFRGVLCQKLEDVLEIIREIDSKHLKMTLDVGHANTVGDVKDFINKEIVHIHIHDNNGVEDEHLPVGEGNINFEEFFKELKKINYKGILTLENKNIRDAIKSRKNIMDILKKI